MDITFRCRAVGGEARVNDDESLEVGWFAVDALPELNEFALFRIKQALSERRPPGSTPRVSPVSNEPDVDGAVNGPPDMSSGGPF